MRFVDTNIFFYAASPHPVFGPTARKILERIEGGEEAMITTMVLGEVAWILESRGRQGDIKSMFDKILSFESLDVEEVSVEDMIAGASNAVARGIDFNDGVNVVVMERKGVMEAYSNDERNLGKVDSIHLIFE